MFEFDNFNNINYLQINKKKKDTVDVFVNMFGMAL